MKLPLEVKQFDESQWCLLGPESEQGRRPLVATVYSKEDAERIASVCNEADTKQRELDGWKLSAIALEKLIRIHDPELKNPGMVLALLSASHDHLKQQVEQLKRKLKRKKSK